MARGVDSSGWTISRIVCAGNIFGNDVNVVGFAEGVDVVKNKVGSFVSAASYHPAIDDSFGIAKDAEVGKGLEYCDE